MISAKIIADSKYRGTRITTFELEYPRFIHSEFMTHRMFSRNCASSRAIPVGTVLKTIKDNPAAPIHWGKNQPGMQANEQLEGNELIAAKSLWNRAMSQSLMYSAELGNLGVHKQIVNRITEPFQHMKTVVTATEWDNWYALRNHKDAQPEIHELASLMKEVHDNCIPDELEPGEWHIPYITETSGDLATDLMISASCCAQVSYRKSDTTVEKAKMIFDKLISMEPKHSSPFEHQATPIVDVGTMWPFGTTHMCRKGDLWSGNFKNWIQYRQLL